MTEFYVIMVKRQDGKVYADLHKTNEVIYGTIEDAYEEWNNNEHFKEYFHIVKLIACLPETLDELAQGLPKVPVEVLEFNGICRDNCQGTKISSLPGLPE